MKYTLDLIPRDGFEYIKHRLEHSFNWLKERGYRLDIDTNMGCSNNNILITLSGPDRSGVFSDSDIVYIFKHQLAEIIAETIMTQMEKGLIRKQVERAYKQLPLAEQAHLAERAVNFLRSCNENENLNLLLKYGRKNKISCRILEHLDHSEKLSLEGLVNFLLKDYLRELRFAVDLAYEEMRSEKQYNEFVKLLKYFVDTQPPKVLEVNVYLAQNGVFYLWDEKGNAIDEECLDFYPEDFLSNEHCTDDVLISILITIAPRRIVFHSVNGLPDTEPARIIKRVFKERIMVCWGCDRCLKYKLKDQ